MQTSQEGGRVGLNEFEYSIVSTPHVTIADLSREGERVLKNIIANMEDYPHDSAGQIECRLKYRDAVAVDELSCLQVRDGTLKSNVFTGDRKSIRQEYCVKAILYPNSWFVDFALENRNMAYENLDTIDRSATTYAMNYL